MKHVAREPDTWRLFWVVLSESDPEAEHSPFPRCVIRSKNCKGKRFIFPKLSLDYAMTVLHDIKATACNVIKEENAMQLGDCVCARDALLVALQTKRFSSEAGDALQPSGGS